jgi:hypothetical protein
MKKCTYCGKTYPDEAKVCLLDQEPLESDAPAPSATPASEGRNLDSSAEPIDADAGLEVPDGFRCLGSFDPSEAARILRQFEAEGIQFLIDRIEKSIETARGVRKQALIEIYVQNEDDEKANKLLIEHWKV